MRIDASRPHQCARAAARSEQSGWDMGRAEARCASNDRQCRRRAARPACPRGAAERTGGALQASAQERCPAGNHPVLTRKRRCHTRARRRKRRERALGASTSEDAHACLAVPRCRRSAAGGRAAPEGAAQHAARLTHTLLGHRAGRRRDALKARAPGQPPMRAAAKKALRLPTTACCLTSPAEQSGVS